MTRDTLNLPATRTWRDIPQPAVPRAMSREGRLRLVMATLRLVALAVVLAVCGWGTWLVTVSLRQDPNAVPAVAKSVPMKPPELHTDGVLDDGWLTRTLALPPKISLIELDLQALRARLLADDQVINATLTRHFPDRLVVMITERGPVARVMTEWLGAQRALLVARDGVIYSGIGYNPAVIETLPWLDGVSIKPDGGHFRPIEGMNAAAELLAKARLEAEHLYERWNVVSLARLASDRKLEVRAKDGSYIVYFTTTEDYFPQLARLNYICDQLVRVPSARVTIDLTLGRDVPVTPVPVPGGEIVPPQSRPAPAEARVAGLETLFARHATAPAASTFLIATPQPKKTKREF